MKIFYVFLFLFIGCVPLQSNSQRLQFGGGGGFYSGLDFQSFYGTLHSWVEYSPNKAFFSIYTTPGIIFTEHNPVGTFPLFLKFNIGKRFRICPDIGAYYNTNKRWGMSGGLVFDYIFKKRFVPFIRTNLRYEFYKTTYAINTTPWSKTKLDQGLWLYISFGFSVNILRVP